MRGAPLRFEGTLRSWNDERGFGFIEPAQGGQEIFVHAKAFPRSACRPQAGQRLSFEVEPGPQGKKRARNVEPVRPPRAPASPRRPVNEAAQWGTATLLAIPAFTVLFLVAGLLWRPPAWLPLLYLVLSALTFVAYAMDKGAARRGAWRTSESTLHALALAGGWPGALLAQQFLRHKSTKPSFRSTFWTTVVANVIAFLVIASTLGRGSFPLS